MLDDKKRTGKEYFNKINEYVDTHKRDSYTKLIFGILLVVLSLGYFSLKNQMVMSMEIPPKLEGKGTLMVGYDKANNLYYEVWGKYFVDEYTSLNPVNSKDKLNHLLTMVESSKAVSYSPLFEKKMKYIIANKINQKYKPSTEEVLSQKQQDLWIYHSEGVLEEHIDSVVIRKHCEYNFGMRVQEYQLLLSLINEKCTKIGSI